MPGKYWIDVYSACNLRCIMCPQSAEKFKRQAEMPMSMFKEIIDSVCKNNPLIKLYMSGEPLLHKDIFAMIEYAGGKGCQTMIHTNATLLTEEVSKKLLSSKLNYLTFSFDGCSAEIYEKLRPPAKFKKTKLNILRYLDLRSNHKNNGPHTSIEIIKMKDTVELIDNFIDQWKKSGVDVVNIREYLTWLDAVKDRRTEIPANNSYQPCPNVFYTSSILSDGTVVPCCMDVYGKMPLGNIKDESFRNIWFGEKYLKLRENMINGSFSEESICHDCVNTFSRNAFT